MKNIEITIVVMTFNHKNYIEQAIQSILSQKIDVDFKILIHDDCSDDGTYEILLDLQRRNPNKITIIHQQSRKFLSEGFNLMLLNYVVPNIDTRYVAYCDGDDYWIDENKLKKQYEFMIANPDYSLCFHSAYQLRPNNDLSSKWFIKEEGDLDIKDIISENTGVCIATSSIFMKAEIFKAFPNWRIQYPVEDVPLYIHAALNGKIHRLKDIMCVYRQFASGSWSLQNKNNCEKTINHLTKMSDSIRLFDEETDGKYHTLVLAQISGYDFRIALLKKDFSKIFDKKYKRIFKTLRFREKLSLYMQYKMPSIYSLIRHH